MNMSNLPDAQNKAIPEESVIRDLINVQHGDLEVKRLEASNRKAEIESNERIALASIQAQSNSDLYHSKTFKYAYLVSQLKVVVIAIIIAVIVGLAIVYGYSELATDIAKYAFFAISGYFAGLGHSQVIQRRKNTSISNKEDE